MLLLSTVVLFAIFYTGVDKVVFHATGIFGGNKNAVSKVEGKVAILFMYHYKILFFKECLPLVAFSLERIQDFICNETQPLNVI